MLCLIKNLRTYVSLLSLGLLLQTQTLLAQEICNNGIDDDANGLIDLNDTLSCTCQVVNTTTVASLIPNPSFEGYDCIPSYFAQVSCAQGWIQASGATSDYFHTSGFMPDNGILPLAPTPLPDGNGFVGYVDGSITGIGGYKEYIGSCLTSPMLTGEDYTMQVQMGFSSFNSGFNISSNSPTELCIYGNANCSALPFSVSYGCPLDYNPDNWVLLTCVTVSGSGEWVTAELNFTPTQDINAIVLGPNCTSVPSGGGDIYYYYYLDNLVLNESSAFEASAINVLPDCSGSALLSINNPNQYALQWYQNGIAIAGATTNQLNLPPNSGGMYQVMVDNGTTCAVAQTTVPNQAPPTANAGVDKSTACSTAVALAATGTGAWTGGAGMFSDASSPTSTYTPTAGEGGTNVTLTWEVAATVPCTVAATDQVDVAVGSCIVPTATVSADVADPCFCVTVPVLNASNVVTTPGILGDVMTITTSPATTGIVWNLAAAANTTITGATAIDNGNGTYTVNVNYNDGAGWAVTATPTAPNTGLGVQIGTGGTTCSYNIGSFPNLTATACTALTISGATPTPAGSTYNPTSIAAPAPGSAATTVPLQYTYNSSVNAAGAAACPLTLNATATIPACPVGCATSSNMQWGN